MTTGLAPVFGLDHSHPETPGYMGAMTRPTEDFGRDVNRGKGEGRSDPLSDANVLSRVQEAHRQAQTYYQANLAAAWERSYKAFRNEHFRGSKYNAPEFRGRSKVFRPKTRSALRKALTNIVNALFANPEAVTIGAQDESNPMQRASAALKQELLNYRLSRKSRRNGIRWYQIAVGARADSMLTGVSIAKQSWRYRRNPRTGKVLEDRPEVTLYPPENVLVDPNADWIDPAQTAAYLILKNPMTAEDALAMIEGTRATDGGGIPWIEGITAESLRAGGQTESAENASSIRSARTGGTDPKNDASAYYQTVWLHECFVRIEGVEYVFWTLGNTRLLSRPQPVEDAYPCYFGERPVVIGYGAFEPHRVFPMAPVESWQPLQMEANDVTNLRLDHMKMLVSRPMKVKRGAKVDLQQVQRRGPGSVILLNGMEDIEPEEMPDVPQSAYVESQYMNADFDELAGSFSTGTVQTSRSLNETVGGMKLLAGDANQVGEFDLTVFVETFIEPVLWQIVKLEEYYETDATLLALCGRKSRILEMYGINEITDEFLQMEATVTVNVGVGSSSSPADKVNRWITAAQGVGQVLLPLKQAGVPMKLPVPKVKEMIDTVFGGAGFHAAADRFFQPIDDDADFQEAQAMAAQGPPPDPEKEAKAAAIQQKAQMDASLAMQKAQQEAELHRIKLQIEQQKAELRTVEAQMKLAMQMREFELEQALREQQAALQHSISENEAAFKASEQAYALQLKGHNAQANVEAMRAKTSLIGQPKPGQTDANGRPVKATGKPYQPNIPDAPMPMLPGSAPAQQGEFMPPVPAGPREPAAPAQPAEPMIYKRLVAQMDQMTQALVAIGERLVTQPQGQGEDAAGIRANRKILETLGTINEAVGETRDAMAATANVLAQTAQTLGEIKGGQDALAKQVTAPAQITRRGADGRALTVRKGTVEYDVTYDGGKPSGINPKGSN